MKVNELKNSINFYVYILRTSSNTLYIGQTNNLEKRLKEHKNKTSKSAKYMRSFSSFKLAYAEEHASRSSAMKREHELKQWPKAKKEALVKSLKDHSNKSFLQFSEFFYKLKR